MSEKKYMKHPHTWMLPMSYQPKIQAVRDDTCTQTIRPWKDIRPGDYVWLFEKEGHKYYGKWVWKKKRVVTEVFTFRLLGPNHMGWMVIPSGKPEVEDTVYPMNEFALRDGIDPPTGEALVDVLFGFYGGKIWDMEFVAIRWDRGDIKQEMSE